MEGRLNMSFAGIGHNRPPAEKRKPDCICHTCDREYHHLGITRHRAMHRDKNEDCRITFSSGKSINYNYSKNAK